MRKRLRSASAASVAAVFLVSIAAAGCGKYSFSSLKAKKNYREANDLYTAQKWREAAENYERAAASDPTLEGVFFFLGNSYDNMYKPSRVGDPENDSYIQKAIENYRIAAEKDPNPLFRERAMQYLVAAYGPDKLNNPAEAEPVVKRMIEMQPNEPTNYFALSRIYEDAGRYEEAEQALLKAREVRPNDPLVYTTLSGFYNRQGDFERTMESLHKAADLKPTDPTGYQLVATYYWEKSFKDHRLAAAQKKDFILRGLEATDKAISLNPDYAEALTYKNILLRMQANLETDRAKQDQLIKEADTIRSKAMELNKKRASGLK
jgi:tetratricopeptide (TPR) repeat protein